MADDFFDSIDDAVANQNKADVEASDAPKFDPEEGETLKAVLLKVEPFTKGRFDPTFILHFRNVGDETVGGVEPGKAGVMFASTVVRRKFLEAQPAQGTPFALRFEGSVTPETGGNAYKDWTLVTKYMKSGDSADIAPEMWASIQLAIVPRAKQATSGPQAGPFTTDTDSGWKF